MVAGLHAGHARRMINELPGGSPDGDLPPAPALSLTGAEFDALVVELRELRARSRSELAGRLREARNHGSPGDDDDVLSVLEEVSIHEARIARLEELVRSAPIVELPEDGSASVGCTVHATDAAGRTTQYRLVGRRTEDADRHDVSPGSPVGRALIGATAGDVVRVELPGGRVRELRVLRVVPTPSNDPAAERPA
jgi:transcription elongation factor GreA